MARVPIPQDWDGKSWACLQIEWPDSQNFIGILTGFLSQMKMGWFWDEKTGTITVQQDIGREIFSRNFPYSECTDDECTHEDETCLGGGITILGENDMGQVVTAVYKDEVTGELVVEYGKCCIERFSLGSLPPEVDEDVADDPWPEETEYSACGQASALMELLYAVGFALWSERDNFPWQWSGHVKDKFPGLSMSASFITLGVINGQVLAVIYLDDEEAIFIDGEKQSMLCRLVGQLTDTYTTPTNMKDIMHSIVQGEFGIDASKVAFWGSAIEAIGNNDLRNTALSGSTNITADCDCPEPPYQASSVWFDGTFQGPQGGDFTDNGSNASESGRRFNCRLQTFGAGNKHFDNFEPNLLGGNVGDVIKIRAYPTFGEGVDGKVPALISGGTTTTIPEDEWTDHYIDASPSGVTRDDQTGYVEWEQNADVANLPQWIEIAGWKYPIAEVGGLNWYWTLEIVAVNGVDLTPIGPGA